MGLFQDLKEFMFTSDMAKKSDAYAIGAATADFAKVITFSMLIPCIQMPWHPSAAWDKLDLYAVLEHLLYWFCVIFVAYILAELFFSEGILGIKTTIDDKDKQRLKVAEQGARQNEAKIVNAITAPDSALRPNIMPFQNAQ